ncbi:MAG: CCA tRNA nucleotidyltransferase [Clostridia bacterium]|nr:CCA tRNA nucleotidyltransferase [Clostridia bacterium]
MELLPEVEEVLAVFKESNFEIYLVGGCVRDYIMERKINDIDMCTNAKPKDIMKLFNRVIPLGIKYGTVHILVGDKEFEVTTYRKDGIYKDGRKPESVKFVSELKDDLERRDFTINAMAYNPDKGLIDIFGGKKDIKSKIVRTVGDPNKRFSEDALRMIRGIRFATELEFSIEKETFNTIVKNKELINKISKDRIRNELNKILISNHLETGMKYLIDTELYNILFERQYETYEEQYQIVHERVKNLDLIDLSDEEALKVVISVLFYNRKNTEQSIEFAYKYLKKYNYPNTITKDVLNILKYIDMIPDDIAMIDEKFLRKQISKLRQLYPLYLSVMKAIFYEDKKELIEHILDKLCKIDHKSIIYMKNELAINGKDLIELGFPRGKAISVALDELMDLVLEKPELNTKDNLLDYIRKTGIEGYIREDPSVKLKKNSIERLKSEIVLNNRLVNEAKILDQHMEKLGL